MCSEADRVEWIVANVTTWKPGRPYDVWHDRAAFHFLTDEADRAAYVETLDAALSDTGHAIVATFALDGPERCSGLPVQRLDSIKKRQLGHRKVCTVRRGGSGHWR